MPEFYIHVNRGHGIRPEVSRRVYAIPADAHSFLVVLDIGEFYHVPVSRCAPCGELRCQVAGCTYAEPSLLEWPPSPRYAPPAPALQEVSRE